MSSELGIGTRVWVGWAYDPHVPKYQEDPRLRYATIIDGPWLPGEIHHNTLGRLAKCPTWTKWRIQFDTGWCCMAAEFLLTPVGGDDEEVEESEERREAEPA